MRELTIRDLITALEEDIELGIIDENSFAITMHNSHLGYITDWIQKENNVEFQTRYDLGRY